MNTDKHGYKRRYVTTHGISGFTWQTTVLVTAYRGPEIFVSSLVQRIMHT